MCPNVHTPLSHRRWLSAVSVSRSAVISRHICLCYLVGGVWGVSACLFAVISRDIGLIVCCLLASVALACKTQLAVFSSSS